MSKSFENLFTILKFLVGDDVNPLYEFDLYLIVVESHW